MTPTTLKYEAIECKRQVGNTFLRLFTASANLESNNVLMHHELDSALASGPIQRGRRLQNLTTE